MRDTFRKKYSPNTEATVNKVLGLKQAAEALESLMLDIKSREMALALTNLEQAVMWATKAVYLEADNGQ